MSLQVWLPLTKDLRNQGLANVTVTNNGATFDSAGKLGGCYSFPTTGGNLDIPSNAMSSFISSNGCSLAFWIKLNAWNTGYETYFQAGTGSTPWNNYIFGILRNNTASTVCFTIGNGSTVSNASYLTSAWETEVWFHMVFTYETGKCKIYKNGVLDKEYTTSIVPDFSKITKITIGRCNNNSSYQTNCNMNDIRIYNHCLSPMEVKQISQGLVLHYSFSDDNLESTTNLVTREDGLSDTCYNGATSKYGYGTNTDIYKTVGTFQNRKSTKIYMGTAGLNAYPYIYFDAFNAAGAVIQTLSFDYYPTLQNTIIPYSYNGAYNFSYTTNKTSGSASNVSQITIPVEVGRWNHITVTAQKTDTTNTSRGIGYIRIGSASHTSATTNYWLFSNVQVEAKNHATGYAGVGGTRNSTIVYDCSGFVNNGTINGALTISSDTPKYVVSTKITPNSNIQFTPMLAGAYSWTIAAWIKPTVANNDGKAWFSVEQNTYWQVTCYSNQLGIRDNSIGGTGTRKNYSFGTIAANTWIHLVATYDNGTLKLYNNGVLQNTNTVGGTYLNTMNSGRWGSAVQDGYYWNGQISDARIYATALSADDVKSLYQNCATIDPDGTIRGQIRS